MLNYSEIAVMNRETVKSYIKDYERFLSSCYTMMKANWIVVAKDLYTDQIIFKPEKLPPYTNDDCFADGFSMYMRYIQDEKDKLGYTGKDIMGRWGVLGTLKRYFEEKCRYVEFAIFRNNTIVVTPNDKVGCFDAAEQFNEFLDEILMSRAR